MARNAVLSLLNELHQQKTELLQPHKRRELFTEIAKILQTQGHDVSLEMCDRKWRGLQSMYKKIWIGKIVREMVL